MVRPWIEALLCLWCCIWFFNSVICHRCYSCRGLIDTKCESVTTEIECPTNTQLVYDSCYTVTRVMDYPYLGRYTEVLKNCSVQADCSFLKLLLCDNPHNFVNSCSIECCSGDKCNNKTVHDNASSVTRGNIANTSVTSRTIIKTSVTSRTIVKRTVTLPASSNNATDTPLIASGINMTPSDSSIRATVNHESAPTSWTSAKSQEAIFGGASSPIEPTDNVKAVSGDAQRIYAQLSLLLMSVLIFALS